MNDHDEDFEYDDDFPESMDLFEYDEELDFDLDDSDWEQLDMHPQFEDFLMRDLEK